MNKNKLFVTEEGLFYCNFEDRIKFMLSLDYGSNRYSPRLVNIRDNYGINKGLYLNAFGELEQHIDKFGIYIIDWKRYLKDNNIDFEYEDFTKREFVYDKLVRDNIPDKIIKNGENPIYRQLNDEEYWSYLLKKDKEELLEVEQAVSLEERKKELADKLELIKAMAEYNGFTLQDIIEEAEEKKNKNGSFTKRLLLEKVLKK